MLIKQLNGFKNIMELFDEENYHNDRLKSELVVDMTKIYMCADIDKDCEKEFLDYMMPFYKKYKINRKLNTTRLFFNVLINFAIKLFSLNKSFLIFSKKLFVNLKSLFSQ